MSNQENWHHGGALVTLLMRLEGPFQSCGTSRAGFKIRDTAAEPTKSGATGILCAAIGKPRQEVDDDGFPRLEEFARMPMAVRVDREGVLVEDFHTVGAKFRLPKSEGGTSGNLQTSTRIYLSNASFLVGFEGPEDLLRMLDDALGSPIWTPYLGRKSCPPSVPMRLPGGGIRMSPLMEAIESEPAPSWLPAMDEHRFVVEDDSSMDTRDDVLLDMATRRFGARRVRTYWKPIRPSVASPV